MSLTNKNSNGQDEIVNSGGQLEPAGMHMIYLPYSDDIRNAEQASGILFDWLSLIWFNFYEIFILVSLQFHISDDAAVPRASDDQIQKASALMKQINLEKFSVLQFANPGAVQSSIFFPYWFSHILLCYIVSSSLGFVIGIKVVCLYIYINSESVCGCHGSLWF